MWKHAMTTLTVYTVGNTTNTTTVFGHGTVSALLKGASPSDFEGVENTSPSRFCQPTCGLGPEFFCPQASFPNLFRCPANCFWRPEVIPSRSALLCATSQVHDRNRTIRNWMQHRLAKLASSSLPVSILPSCYRKLVQLQYPQCKTSDLPVTVTLL